MTTVPFLPNEILVKILEYAGPETATTARRSSKLFNSLVEKFGLGKHICEELIIRSERSIYTVRLVREAANGKPKELHFNTTLSCIDQLFQSISNKLIHSIAKLILVNCRIDVISLEVIHNLCVLLKKVRAFHNQICNYQCTAAIFGDFVAEHKFVGLHIEDRPFVRSDGYTSLGITNETFKKYMPSTLVFSQMDTFLTDEFLELLEANKPKRLRFEKCQHQISFLGLIKLVKEIDVASELDWDFGYISEAPARLFFKFFQTLRVQGFQPVRRHHAHLFFQYKRENCIISFNRCRLTIVHPF